MCCRDRPSPHSLRQQPAVKLQQAAAITRRALGKKHDRQPRIHSCLHSFTCLDRRPAPSPRDINRSRHRSHPPKYGHRCDLRLRYEDTRTHSRKHHNIDIAQMIRDHRPACRKTPHYNDIDFQPLQRSSTEPMQPVCPGLSCLRPLHQQLSSISNEVSCNLNASRQRPEKTHPINLALQSKLDPPNNHRRKSVYPVNSESERTHSRRYRTRF